MSHIDETGILSVVDAIYSAASDFALWPEALIRVADLLGAADAAFGTMGPEGIACLKRRVPTPIICEAIRITMPRTWSGTASPQANWAGR